MSAVAAKPQAGGAMNPTAMAVGVVMLLIILGTLLVCFTGRSVSWHSSVSSSAVS